jgi:hypothetical protein
MERGRGRYTTLQLYHHSFTNYLYLPHIAADSYSICSPLVNLQQPDSLGMTRINDIREVSGSEQKERSWIIVTWPI